MSESGSNWLDVVRSAFWPITVLIALWTFSDSLLAVSSAIARNAGATEELGIGSLRIKLNTTNARNIPPAPASVSDVLIKLNANHIDKLLGHEPGGGISVCFGTQKNPNAENPEADIGLMNYYKKAEEDYRHFISIGIAEGYGVIDLNPMCSQGTRFVRLTELGENTRRHLIEVLTQAVTIAPK